MNEVALPEENTVLPFELAIGEENTPITNGDVPITWCITPEFAVTLEENGIIDPHVLLVTVKNTKEMQRQLLPLSEMMTFARFTKAGHCRVYAWILNGQVGRKELHKSYTRKFNGDYRTDVINEYSGEPYEKIEYSVGPMTSGSVKIPEDVFAKEPSPFIKWYVNLWHKGKPKDGCHFRQRAFISLFKSIPVLGCIFGKTLSRMLIAAGFILFGSRQAIKYKTIFRPFYCSFFSIFDDDVSWESSFSITKNIKIGNHEEQFSFYTPLALTPLIWVIAGLVGLIFINGLVPFHQEWAIHTLTVELVFVMVAFLADVIRLFNIWWEQTELFETLKAKSLILIDYLIESKIIYGLLIIVAIAAVISIISSMYMYWDVVKYAYAILVPFILGFVVIFKMSEWKYIDPQYNKPTEVVELMCPCDDPQIKNIPAKQTSWRLRFLNWKNKVCKPMQS